MRGGRVREEMRQRGREGGRGRYMHQSKQHSFLRIFVMPNTKRFPQITTSAARLVGVNFTVSRPWRMAATGPSEWLCSETWAMRTLAPWVGCRRRRRGDILMHSCMLVSSCIIRSIRDSSCSSMLLLFTMETISFRNGITLIKQNYGCLSYNHHVLVVCR